MSRVALRRETRSRCSITVVVVPCMALWPHCRRSPCACHFPVALLEATAAARAVAVISYTALSPVCYAPRVVATLVTGCLPDLLPFLCCSAATGHAAPGDAPAGHEAPWSVSGQRWLAGAVEECGRARYSDMGRRLTVVTTGAGVPPCAPGRGKWMGHGLARLMCWTIKGWCWVGAAG